MERISFFLCLLLTCWSLAGCEQDNPAISPAASILQTEQAIETRINPASPARTPLVVFCAGSLILPFADLEKGFEEQNPDVDVLTECHGSIQVIRHVTELHENIDVVATADHALIPMLMYETLDPETGRPYASWYIRFAGNRLSLAYTPESKYATEISPENWYEVIARPGVKLGIADPRFDASGYRALMSLKMAESFYGKAGLLNNVIKDRFKYPITVFGEVEYTEITVPEIIEPIQDSGMVIRGASIQLIALLESGDLDYAFEYESVIRQHGLQMKMLPDQVNLGLEDLANLYDRVEVKLDFHRFATVKPIFKGEPIGYGITIPGNAPQPELAVQFIDFLLGPEGRQIMQNNYQPLIVPMQCNEVTNMPPVLREYCP